MVARPSSTARQALAIYESKHEARLRTWVQLARTFYRIHRRIMTALARHDVTMPQFDILATLRFNIALTQQELAERLLVTKGNVCGVLDRLEGLGWVERRPDAQDKRANRLHLTAAGRKKLHVLLPEHDALVLQAMAALTDGDVRSLRRMLETVEQSGPGE
jgi:MarR family transcriptional regulator, organic hydroperoxide resistance regulator